ncbi:hypothetical protein M8C21_007946 [Ambrosia artemisiifolia]|uniref:Uncharacterized protein n=1 Tax=Ambrosia artemisiifolia TaxID=4212 RepID=A0AAD5CM94_AMBAR|nr:hypothetical protein M8C21_007946 [Ambrosia artemisiifolia]
MRRLMVVIRLRNYWMRWGDRSNDRRSGDGSDRRGRRQGVTLGKQKFPYMKLCKRIDQDQELWENGCARVVSASCSIGEAVEHVIRIHNIMEKTRTKKAAKGAKRDEKVLDVSKEQEGLHKKVTNLMKKQ